MIREFMRTVFPKIIDTCFALSLLMVLLGAFVGAAAIPNGFFITLITFLFVLIFGIIAVVLSYGFIYVLLDIRDSLQDK